MRLQGSEYGSGTFRQAQGNDCLLYPHRVQKVPYRHKNRLHRYLHEVWQPEANGLVTERSGDWNWGDWGEHVDMGVLTNCWYYLALKAELNFAAMLGKEDDVRMLTGMMNSFVSCFNTKYWNGSAYRSPGYKGETDDRAQAMAVVSGLAAADKYPA